MCTRKYVRVQIPRSTNPKCARVQIRPKVYDFGRFPTSVFTRPSFEEKRTRTDLYAYRFLDNKSGYNNYKKNGFTDN